MTINIIVNGALGRMGREIIACALAEKDVRLCGCVEHPQHPHIGKDTGVCIGREPIGVPIGKDFSGLPVETAVVIDFSSADVTTRLLEAMMQRKTKLVIGTTGISEDGLRRIDQFSKKGPVVYSPNMSLGVNLLFYLTELLALKLNKEFDIEIIEAHHRFKKDSPSGTAKKLGEIVASTLGLSYDQAIKNGRSGIVGERTKKEIGMHAVRGGDIVGDHTVLFAGIGERIEIRHMAHSRTALANGAVLAAKWISSHERGLFSMKEVLGLSG